MYEKKSLSSVCLCLVSGSFRLNYMNRFRPQLHVQIALSVGAVVIRVKVIPMNELF